MQNDNINLAVSCQWTVDRNPSVTAWQLPFHGSLKTAVLKPSLKGKVALRSNDGRVLTNDKFIFFILFVKIIGKVVWQPKIFIDFCLPYDIMNIYWKQKCVLLFRTYSVELIFRILFNLRSEILCQTAHSSIFHAIL